MKRLFESDMTCLLQLHFVMPQLPFFCLTHTERVVNSLLQSVWRENELIAGRMTLLSLT